MITNLMFQMPLFMTAVGNSQPSTMAQPKSRTAVTIFKKNVNVLRYNDVTRSESQVFAPIPLKLAEFKKSESQYQRDVEFTIYMTDYDVKRRLEEKFPDLKNQRYASLSLYPLE